jgi:hypothetical protein
MEENLNKKRSRKNKSAKAIARRKEEFANKFKTEMCKNWEAGYCEFSPNCCFAHGEDQLRQTDEPLKACK